MSCLCQIFPSRKANNAVSLASPKLESSPSARKEKRKENPSEVSPHKKGTLESFIVRSKSSENPCIGHGVFGEKQDGFSGYVRQSTWPKPSSVSGRADGTNSTDSWLQRCGPNVSKFVPKRLLGPEIGASDFSTPKSLNASPVSSQSKLVSDDLHTSRETVPRGQFSQFADDFLSVWVRYRSSHSPVITIFKVLAHYLYQICNLLEVSPQMFRNMNSWKLTSLLLSVVLTNLQAPIRRGLLGLLMLLMLRDQRSTDIVMGLRRMSSRVHSIFCLRI